MALKWGIASAGKISFDFVNALGTLNEDEHEVVAVAARDLSRAEEFAERFGIPKAYGTYLELAEDPDVEVVYIGTLNPQHLEQSIMMLEHGKHVLCEKPMCMNKKQVQQLVDCAREKNLFLMEAIWSRFFPSYQYIRKQIEDGMLGEIVSIEAEFSVPGWAEADRAKKKELGGSILMDLGIYPIQLCQWVFQEEPTSIEATGILNDEGVDAEVSAELTYGDNKVAKIKASGLDTQRDAATIVGTEGTITIPLLFRCATSLIDVDGTEKNFPLPEAKYEFNYSNSCGLRYEADATLKCIRAGKIESENISHDESLLIAQIEDEIRKQIGVEYPEDAD